VPLLSDGEAGRRHPGAIGPRAVAEDVCSRGIAIAAFVEDRQEPRRSIRSYANTSL
jgi:hypothetical protein